MFSTHSIPITFFLLPCERLFSTEVSSVRMMKCTMRSLVCGRVRNGRKFALSWRPPTCEPVQIETKLESEFGTVHTLACCFHPLCSRYVGVSPRQLKPSSSTAQPLRVLHHLTGDSGGCSGVRSTYVQFSRGDSGSGLRQSGLTLLPVSARTPFWGK